MQTRWIWLGLVAWGVTAWASDSGTAAHWVEQTRAKGARSYSCDVTGSVLMSQGGQFMNTHIKGNLVYKDISHGRFKSTMTLKMGEQEFSMKFMAVYDGACSWEEMQLPNGEAPLVGKTKIEGDKEWDQSGMDLANWLLILDQIEKADDLKWVAEDDTTVTLNCLLSAEEMEKLGMELAPNTAKDNLWFEVVLGKTLLFPKSLQVGDRLNPAVSFSFSEVQIIETSELPDEAFSYTPPENVTVQEN